MKPGRTRGASPRLLCPQFLLAGKRLQTCPSLSSERQVRAVPKEGNAETEEEQPGNERLGFPSRDSHRRTPSSPSAGAKASRWRTVAPGRARARRPQSGWHQKADAPDSWTTTLLPPPPTDPRKVTKSHPAANSALKRLPPNAFHPQVQGLEHEPPSPCLALPKPFSAPHCASDTQTSIQEQDRG